MCCDASKRIESHSVEWIHLAHYHWVHCNSNLCATMNECNMQMKLHTNMLIVSIEQVVMESLMKTCWTINLCITNNSINKQEIKIASALTVMLDSWTNQTEKAEFPRDVTHEEICFDEIQTANACNNSRAYICWTCPFVVQLKSPGHAWFECNVMHQAVAQPTLRTESTFSPG